MPQFQPFDPSNPNSAPSPLADPITSAIFSSVEEAGLAAESLIRETLKSDGNEKLLGKIIRVTPQHSHISPRYRSCRVDIESETDSNEHIIVEVQTSRDPNIMRRDLFTASHIYVKTSNKGDSPTQMATKMPRVIFINILGYNIRSDNNDLVQPFKVLYTKPPHDIAIPNFCGYNIQLPKVEEMKPDFNSGLYCWCYTLYTAHKQNKSIQEVITMTPALQAYTLEDTGFLQFCKRYNLIAGTETARWEYQRWIWDTMREEGILEGAREEALEQGQVIATENLARKMKEAGYPIKNIIELTGLTHNKIQEL
ncbi:MAG: Rpn family recombination-promoting nuclease/putative transposase [Defluviitaleaceae bacterium]|nr:Rpn family recombination-promoting nuclease/putative transposase [Defluviitaleaceae bacterium]